MCIRDSNYTFTDVIEVEGVKTELLDITDAEAVNRMVKEKDIKCIVNCACLLYTSHFKFILFCTDIV